MPQLEQLLRLMLLGSRVMEGALIKRAVLNFAVLLVLAMLVGAMLATLLVIGLYVTYQLLLGHGVGTNEALLITTGVTASLVLVFALIGMHRFRRVTKRLSVKPGLASKVGETAEAFIDGLLTPSAPKD